MHYTLTLLGSTSTELAQAVHSSTGDEGAAYLLCGVSVTDDEVRLLAREVIPVEERHYLHRSHDRLSIDSASYASAAKRARTDRVVILFVHSHPNGPPDFSPQDDREEPKLMEFLAKQAPGSCHGSLVLTPDENPKGRIWTDTGWAAIERIRTIGPQFRFIDHSDGDAVPQVFDRQVKAFGKVTQQLLKRLHVGIVGAGGTGSAVVEQLARLGVGTISVFDGDALEASNVTRVYGTTLADAGQNKAILASKHIERIGLGTTVRTFPKHITNKETALRLRDCDVVFGCTDKHAPRGHLVQLALRYYIPVFDLGVKIDSKEGMIHGIFGRVTTLIPGEACLFCRERIKARMIALEALSPSERQALVDEEYAPELDTDAPAVITFTTAVAAQAVSELLHRLTAYSGLERQSSEALLLFHESSVRTNRTPPSEGCLCTQKHLWGRGDGRDFLGLTWSE